MCTFQIADQRDRERPDAAVYGGERVAIFRNRQPERLGSADAKFLPDGSDEASAWNYGCVVAVDINVLDGWQSARWRLQSNRF
jgi:hypothetical protein